MARLTMGTAPEQKITMGKPANQTISMGTTPSQSITMAPSQQWASSGPRPGDGSNVAGYLFPAGTNTGGGGGGTNTDTGGTGGWVGGGAPAYISPSQAQLDPVLASLAELDGILTNKNTQAKQEYEKMLGEYGDIETADREARDRNVFQNESTYTGNNQAALLNAANAASGLRGVLSSLGGLAGSGVDVIRRLVGLAANQDVGSSRKTFDINAESLNTAWSDAERTHRQRKTDAESTYKNTVQNNKAQILNSRQGMYEKLANMHDPLDPGGKTYASKAAALAPQIARTTQASVAPYAKADAAFSPAALQEYLAGTQNLNVSTAGGPAPSTPINSPVYGQGRRRDQLAGVA